MNLAAFTVAGELERITGSDDYRVDLGLARQHPVAAVALLSPAGSPPVAGRGWGFTAWALAAALLLLGVAPGLPLSWLTSGRSLLS